MNQYNFQSDEMVILKQNRISYGGSRSGYTDELILTNLNLILISKGVFGKVKDTLVFPVDQIKIFNGKAQAILGKRANGLPQLEVYFTNGQEYFGFEKKKVVIDWVNTINELLLGQDIVIDRSNNMAIPGTEFIAGSIKDTIDTVKDVIGIKHNKNISESKAKVAKKCNSCRAPISGFKGQIVRCHYCDTDQEI